MTYCYQTSICKVLCQLRPLIILFISAALHLTFVFNWSKPMIKILRFLTWSASHMLSVWRRTFSKRPLPSGVQTPEAANR